MLVSISVTLGGAHGVQYPPIGGLQDDHRSTEQLRRPREVLLGDWTWSQLLVGPLGRTMAGWRTLL